MKQKFRVIGFMLSLVIITALFVSLIHAQDSYNIDPTPWNGESVATSFALGDGTAERPYVIASAAQLAYLEELVSSREAVPGAYYILGADIDLNHELWFPIGPVTDASTAPAFSGTFDGRGYTIKGMSINAASESRLGLFGRIEDPDTTIQNIVFDDCHIETAKTGSYIGMVVGHLKAGRITGITVNDTCSLNIITSGVGGIAGRVSGSDSVIEFCVNSAKVTVSNPSASLFAGGIVGVLGDEATVRYCVNNGEVSAICGSGSTAVGAGGMVGMLNFSAGSGGFVENCYNTGKITSDHRAGGIAGYTGVIASEPNSRISKCYNLSSEIIGTSASFQGQIIGYVARVLDVSECLGLAGQELQQYGSIGNDASAQATDGFGSGTSEQIWAFCDAIDGAINDELLRLNGIVYYEGGLETSVVTPEDTTPVETTPDETTPDETTPVETTPDATTPDETTPDQTTPDATTPGKTDGKKGCGSSLSIAFLPLALSAGAALTFRRKRK